MTKADKDQEIVTRLRRRIVEIYGKAKRPADAKPEIDAIFMSAEYDSLPGGTKGRLAMFEAGAGQMMDYLADEAFRLT